MSLFLNALAVISCVIASPIAFYFLQHWLLKYDYRIRTGAGVFVVSATITINYYYHHQFAGNQGSNANPVTSLRTE
jgi:putative ABC transport system permease protein